MGKFGDFLLGAIGIWSTGLYVLDRGIDDNGNFSLKNLENGLYKDSQFFITHMKDDELIKAYQEAERGSTQKEMFAEELIKRHIM